MDNVMGEMAVQNKEPSRFNFGYAIYSMKHGKSVAREGWNGKGMFIALQTPTESSKMTLPYIYMSTVGGQFVPWLASQTDMLAEDWMIAD